MNAFDTYCDRLRQMAKVVPIAESYKQIREELGAADAKSAKPFLPAYQLCVNTKKDSRRDAMAHPWHGRANARLGTRRRVARAKLATFKLAASHERRAKLRDHLDNQPTGSNHVRHVAHRAASKAQS